MDTAHRSAQEQIRRAHVRWMIRQDMPEVGQVELASFDFGWTEEDFLRCIRQRNCLGMVAEQGEKVVGYMIYELHKAKLHILNFAVHPTCRRRELGPRLTLVNASKWGCDRDVLSQFRYDYNAIVLLPKSPGFAAHAHIVLPDRSWDIGEKNTLGDLVYGLFPGRQAYPVFHNLTDRAGESYLMAPLLLPEYR